MKSGNITIGSEVLGLTTIDGEGYIMPMTTEQEKLIESSTQFKLGMLVVTDTEVINKTVTETLERNSLLNRLEGILDADTLQKLETMDEETKNLIGENIRKILERNKLDIPDDEFSKEEVNNELTGEGLPEIKPVEDINKESTKHKGKAKK